MNKQKSTAPACIGIIMDGNRRWARERGLPTLEGHMCGYRKLKEVVSWANKAGVETLIFYAFSTENWNRSADEVAYLMRLFETALVDEIGEIQKRGVRLRFLGQRERFSKKLQEAMDQAEAQTKGNGNGTIVLALSYGGRQEIVAAVNTLLHDGTQETSEGDFASRLSTVGIPDPDIIIRPGGEKRLSNFLPWQSVYSELFFSDTYWPDFSKEEFLGILEEYSKRERRRGK